jgi:hypothetical protein
MKNSAPKKRLSLAKQTLRQLAASDLQLANGGDQTSFNCLLEAGIASSHCNVI